MLPQRIVYNLEVFTPSYTDVADGAVHHSERVGTNSSLFRYRSSLEPSGQNTCLHLEAQIKSQVPGPLGHIDTLTTQLFKCGTGENLRKPGHLIGYLLT